MTVHEIVFPYPKPPLSLNDRMHYMKAANITADIRALTHAKTRHLPTMERCRVEFIWWVNDRRKRDDENPIPTMKAMCDGLVDSEIVPEDTAEWMEKLMPTIPYRPKKDGPACIVLRITELPAPPETGGEDA